MKKILIFSILLIFSSDLWAVPASGCGEEGSDCPPTPKSCPTNLNNGTEKTDQSRQGDSGVEQKESKATSLETPVKK